MSIKIQASTTGYLTTKARGRLVQDGYRGVFAKSRIFSGELIAVWGGDILGAPLVHAMPPEQKRLALQVDEDLYLVSSKEGPADWINHCCTPNAGMSGQISLVALRDISAGEEVCFDYAMTDGSPYDEFECRCGAPNCRRRVTGEDWRRWELQDSYRDFFSPYLKKRISASRSMEEALAPATPPAPRRVQGTRTRRKASLRTSRAS